MADKTIKYDDTVVYENGEWVDSSYQNIEVTGGDDATNTTLINTLAANAEGGIKMPKTKTEALEALQKNPQEYAATIAGQLERIEDSKIVIVSKVNELGLNTETDITIDDAALAVNEIVLHNTDLTLESTRLALPEGYYKGVAINLGDVSDQYELQERSVTPAKGEQIVQPEEGFYGLSKVTVAAIPAAYQDVTSVTATADKVLVGSKFVDANGQVIDGAMVNNGKVEATLDVNNTSFTVAQGYHNGEGSVKIELEEKEINAADAINDVVVEPTDGSVLSKVTVKGCGEAQLEYPSNLSFNQDTGVISASTFKVSKGYTNGFEVTPQEYHLNVKTASDIVSSQEGNVINVTVPTGYYQEMVNGQAVSENVERIQLDTTEMVLSDIAVDPAGNAVVYNGLRIYKQIDPTDGLNVVLNYGDSSNVVMAYVRVEDEAGFVNPNYKTIEFTGGEDTTNAELIAFLNANATCVSGQDSISDLTNTKWVLNDMIDLAEDSADSTFNVNVKVVYEAAITVSAQVSEGWISDDQQGKSVLLSELDPNFVAGNIAAGKTVFGVGGTFTADANATAAQILEGSSAYVNGAKVDGTMANLGSVATTVDALNSDATGMVIKSVGNGYTTGGEIKLDNSIYNRLAAI